MDFEAWFKPFIFYRFANVTFISEEVQNLIENTMSPEEEFRLYGPRGRHNGAG